MPYTVYNYCVLVVDYSVLMYIVDRENEVKTEREKNRSMRLAKREQIREKHIAGIREKVQCI